MPGESTPHESIDELFRLPPAEFIGARNALAARLRKGREVAAADEVKALVKPNVSAWVVNQLYWNHRDDFDRLLAAGARLRADQQRGLQGGRPSELAEATRERRESLRGLLRLAELVLAGDGRPAVPATLKRVETTLEAIAALGGAGPEARLGRLARDLEPSGFDALLALAGAAPLAPPSLTPAPGSPDPRKPKGPKGARATPTQKTPKISRRAKTADDKSSPEAQKRAVLEAQSQVVDAVEQLERCRAMAGEAEAARAAAAARARQAVAEAAQAQRRLSQAEKHADRADVALKRTEARKQSADEDVVRARERLAAARVAAEKARTSSS